MPIDLPDYSQARVIKGLYGTDYVTIATDEDGNIIGVFKGDYDGTATTIKVDSLGRMLAIITDPEDVYGNVHQFGNAELAARLGSLCLRDKRGYVQYMDDFEDTALKWTNSATGTGASVSLTNTESYFKDQCVKLICGTSGANKSYIARRFPLSASSRIGMEFFFMLTADDCQHRWKMFIYDGTNRYQMQIAMSSHDTNLTIAHDSASWTTLDSDFPAYEGDHMWHNLKLVCDTATKKYVRLILDDTEYDISAIDVYSTSDNSLPNIYIYIGIENEGTGNYAVYYDGFILTNNEP